MVAEASPGSCRWYWSGSVRAVCWDCWRGCWLVNKEAMDEKAGWRSSITCYLNNRLHDTCQNVALILLLASMHTHNNSQQTLSWCYSVKAFLVVVMIRPGLNSVSLNLFKIQENLGIVWCYICNTPTFIFFSIVLSWYLVLILLWKKLTYCVKMGTRKHKYQTVSQLYKATLNCLEFALERLHRDCNPIVPSSGR